MEHITWLSDLTKAPAALLKAAAERVALWVGHRKSKLYVHFILGNQVWCIAQQAQREGPPLEMMQVTFWGHFNHDDPAETLVITDA